MSDKHIDMKKLFLGLQDEMSAILSTVRESEHHPSAKGDVSENKWAEMLEKYLPKRYEVANKAFAVDHSGAKSAQIDIVIFDRQYSPFIFNQQKLVYIPVESIYAVIEVKQEIDSDSLEYAADKAASVRKLSRTSAPIIDRGEEKKPRKPYEILAGIVALEGSLTTSQVKKLQALEEKRKLNFGGSLKGKSFVVESDSNTVEQSSDGHGLIFFFLGLLRLLQPIGTALPIEIKKYLTNLK